MTYEPQNLKRWTLPQYYFGECWSNYYSAGVGQSRDSSVLEQSNFAVMLKLLGGESETVVVVSESHWAVGWVEWIAIHQDDDKALEIADEAVAALSDYPVLDADDFSEREHEYAQQSWANTDLRERIRICAKNGVSIFAARRDYIPENDDSGGIYDYCLP